ncbi:MAG: M16 family metallopeptidase, partial [bacterium]
AAALEDVQEWFKKYYGAANAVIAIAGDIDTKTAVEKAKQYFGDIPAGPPVATHEVWIARRSGTQRQRVQDRVPQARIYKVWNIPQWNSEEARYLDLVTDVLAAGKTSRLYKRLVYDDQIATSVFAYVDLREIAGQLSIVGTAKPGEDLANVEKAIDEELARFLAEGPTEAEMKRVKTQFVSRFVRGVERIGGFGGKSDILTMNEVYGGSPDFYKTTLKRVREATAQNLHNAAKKWLSDGVYNLEVHPFPKYKTAESTADRSKLPDTGTPPVAKFPQMQRKTLSNGMQIILAERHSVPVVNFNLLLDAGYASDQFGLPGTASLAMNMLDEGTKSRTALQISDELAMLGANLGSGSNLDMSTVFFSSLKENLDASLDIFADVVLNPSFPEADFKRLQKQQLARIQREKVSPIQMALRVFPGLLYGKDHAYGLPFTGSGTEESVAKITRKDLQKFHKTWFKPNNATLIVVGDAQMDEIAPKLEKLFKGWKKGTTPAKNISPVPHKDKSVVYLIDKPGALQSIIFAGHVALPKTNPDEIAIETMNTILGGAFISRLNMNLREDKHWSYGARSLIIDASAQRPFIAYAPVQTDKTKESMVEVAKELSEITGARPASAEELARAQSNKTLRLPGSWETNNAVAGSITEIVRFGLDDNYFETYPQKINALKVSDISSAAKKIVKPDNLVWVIVGDREKIEAGIRELNLGALHFIDADGNPVE